MDSIQVTPPATSGNRVVGVHVLRDGVEVGYHAYQVFEQSNPIEIHFAPPLAEGETVIVTGSSTSGSGSGKASITP
ncbi:MAG: hypothetical protein ACPG31_05350 [Planctomycetota bacterium]